MDFDNDIITQKMRCPRTKGEMERRWALARALMERAGLDMLIAQNDNKYLGGYVRWFIDVPAVQAYPMTVLFARDGGMTTITHGAPEFPLLPEWAMRGPTQRLSSPYVRTLNYTDLYDARLVAGQIRKQNVKRLGVVGRGMLNYALVDYLRENTGVEIVDATRLVDRIKGPKSAEEIACIKASARMHDEVLGYVTEVLHPGMHEYELNAALAKRLIELGSEEQLLMIGSAPMGECAGLQYTHYQNRVIEKGDVVTVMVECSGPGGYYCEMGRAFAVDCAPAPALTDLFAQSREVQRRTAKLLVPGTPVAEITGRVNELLREMHLPEEHRIFTHGQGYDLIEAPGFALEDDFVLQENMCIAVHPTYVTPEAFGFCCDNYLVGPEGTDRLQTYPQEIIRV